jgi:hypothetical protein
MVCLFQLRKAQTLMDANVALVLGIVWNMTPKPSTATAIACLLIAYAVGVGLALCFMRAPADVPAVATEPAG